MSEEQIKASHEALASEDPRNDQSGPQEVSEEELQSVAGGVIGAVQNEEPTLGSRHTRTRTRTR